MLTRLKLTNFKSWRELDLALGPITLLYGTNSSGKSSILQSLLLLKQTIEGLDSNQVLNFGGSDRDLVDLGSYRDVVHSHDFTNELNIKLLFEMSEYPHSVGYESQWIYQDDSIQIQSITHSLDIYSSNPMQLKVTVGSASKYVYETSNGWNIHSMSEPEGFIIGDKISSGESLTPPINSFELPYFLIQDEKSEKKIGISSFGFHLLMIDNFSSLRYLGPLREHPRRTYQWTGSNPQVIGPKGEYAVQALVASKRNEDKLLDKVTFWLNKLGLVQNFEIVSLGNERFYEVLVNDEFGQSSILDTGFGISQVLPVIAILFFAPEGSIILLEQPELHLHPSAQAGLADLMLHVAEERNLQLIVESHSEHLLRRMQRRIAEVDQDFATPDNIKAYFCTPGEDGSQIDPVSIDRFGQISNWPENFFGDVAGDLDAMMDAGIARRRQELNGG